MKNNIIEAMLIFSLGTLNTPLALKNHDAYWFNWTVFGFCCGISTALLVF